MSAQKPQWNDPIYDERIVDTKFANHTRCEILKRPYSIRVARSKVTADVEDIPTV